MTFSGGEFIYLLNYFIATSWIRVLSPQLGIWLFNKSLYYYFYNKYVLLTSSAGFSPWKWWWLLILVSGWQTARPPHVSACKGIKISKLMWGIKHKLFTFVLNYGFNFCMWVLSIWRKGTKTFSGKSHNIKQMIFPCSLKFLNIYCLLYAYGHKNTKKNVCVNMFFSLKLSKWPVLFSLDAITIWTYLCSLLK